jgi:hypothetical protein
MDHQKNINSAEREGRKLASLNRKLKGSSCPNLVALQERTICYCSNFDLNSNDWISTY